MTAGRSCIDSSTPSATAPHMSCSTPSNSCGTSVCRTPSGQPPAVQIGNPADLASPASPPLKCRSRSELALCHAPAPISPDTTACSPRTSSTASASSPSRCARSATPPCPAPTLSLTAPTDAQRSRCAYLPRHGPPPACRALITAGSTQSAHLDREISVPGRSRSDNEPDNDRANTPTTTPIGGLFYLSSGSERVRPARQGARRGSRCRWRSRGSS